MTTDEALTWIAEHKARVDVYSDQYTAHNIRVYYTETSRDGMPTQYGCVVPAGLRSRTGRLTAAEALVGCVEKLQKDSLKREHNGKATALAER